MVRLETSGLFLNVVGAQRYRSVTAQLKRADETRLGYEQLVMAGGIDEDRSAYNEAKLCFVLFVVIVSWYMSPERLTIQCKTERVVKASKVQSGHNEQEPEYLDHGRAHRDQTPWIDRFVALSEGRRREKKIQRLTHAVKIFISVLTLEYRQARARSPGKRGRQNAGWLV